MKDYYTLKEILLGLRNEQFRIQGKLRELEKMLSNYGNTQEKYRFNSENIRRYQFLLNCLMIDNRLKERIYHLLANYTNCFAFKDITDVTLDEFGDNQPLCNDCDVMTEEKQADFNQKIGDILNDRFILDLKDERILVEDKYEVFPSNSMLFSKIISNANDKNRKFNDFHAYISYYKKYELLSLRVKQHYLGKRIDDIINEFLAIKIPKDSFSDYIQNILNNSEDAKKEIIIPSERCFSRHNEFYLNEERNHFALVKKK